MGFFGATLPTGILHDWQSLCPGFAQASWVRSAHSARHAVLCYSHHQLRFCACSDFVLSLWLVQVCCNWLLPWVPECGWGGCCVTQKLGDANNCWASRSVNSFCVGRPEAWVPRKYHISFSSTACSLASVSMWHPAAFSPLLIKSQREGYSSAGSGFLSHDHEEWSTWTPESEQGKEEFYRVTEKLSTQERTRNGYPSVLEGAQKQVAICALSPGF